MADYADPIKCSAVEKNSHVMIKNRPCKIVEISASDDDQVQLRGMDVFTMQLLEDTFPSGQEMEVPIVKRTEWILLSNDSGFLSLLGEDGDQREDLKIPGGELGDQISMMLQSEHLDVDDIKVIIQSACGEELIIDAIKKN